MSEINPRPSGPRGRGSSRRGRGGFSSRGGRGGTRQTNGTKPEFADPPINGDEGEIGQLKETYSSKLDTIKEMFPNWTDEDIVFALQETDGDLEGTVERITEGNISRWGEVKKKTKDRSQSKIKEPANAAAEATSASTRGGRGRGGLDGARGGRGRGSERGRGASRGGRGASTLNGPRSIQSPKDDGAPATESIALDSSITMAAGGSRDKPPQTDSTPLDTSWENVTAEAAQAPVAEEPKPGSKPDGTRSWASIFNKPTPAPAPKAPRAAPSHDAPVEPSVAATSDPLWSDVGGLPPPPAAIETSEIPRTPPTSDLAPIEPAPHITPSKDELTETNVEQVLDTSGPAPSATAASTVASVDTRNLNGGPMPLAPSQQHSSSRPPLGGYATSAYKATGMPGRTASYQRKILEQQEAVVMPGKQAVDRAAVQFGSMGLNGTSEDLDVDSDREDAETRAQPPQHSPIAPRASLPPAPLQQGFGAQPQQSQMGDSLLTPRQAPGLPLANQHPGMHQQNPPLLGEQGPSQQSTQSGYPFGQYGDRYGTQTAQQEIAAPTQKAYEPFGQQMQQTQQYDGHPLTSQAPGHSQQQVPSQQGAFSSASNDPSSYYTSDGQRNAYQNSYYGNYGQQTQQPAQDTGGSQQKAGSAFGTSTATQQPSQYPTSQNQQVPQARYGQTTETRTSGHSTPNPSLAGQAPPSQPSQTPQSQQQVQGQGQGGQHGSFAYSQPSYYGGYYSGYMNQVSNNHPYGRERPMFDDARRYDDHYLTQTPQYGYGANQGGYGGGAFGGAGGKQGMYGQPHQGYGMSPQTAYDQHSASPANAGAFGQQHSASGRDSTAAGNLGGYGRSSSAQPTDNPQQFSSAAGSQGSMPDVFSRSHSNYPGQGQNLGTNVSQQGGNDDSLRGFNDSSKVPSGPSPALGQPAGRPGSTATLQNQSGLPAPHSQNQGQGQQSYVGYPSHLGHQMPSQHSSQYGAGPGTLGGHQSGSQNQQASGYGGYGAGYGGNYYNNSNRGGWGANYGH